MKISTVLICMMGVLNSFAASANPICQDKYGTLHCGSGSVDSIDYRGFVEVEGTTVLGSLHVVGNADIRSAFLKKTTIRGDSHFSKTEISGLMKIVGNVHARETEIKNFADIVGNFNGEQITFYSIANVIGNLDCDKCSFKNSTSLIGDITTNNSEFAAPLTLNAKSSIFSHSTIKDITVKKPHDFEEQIIYLKENSVAHNITFESQRGIVVLDNHSNITGVVQGGKVIKNSAGTL